MTNLESVKVPKGLWRKKKEEINENKSKEKERSHAETYIRTYTWYVKS